MLKSGFVGWLGFRFGLSFANWLCEVEFWYCEMYWIWISIVICKLVV
jgi:hypothetical protein